MQRGTLLMLVAGILVATLALAHSSSAMPMYQYGQPRHNKDYLVELEDPDAVLETLAKLGQSILKAQHEGTKVDLRRMDSADAKRGLDLGLGRGFSGSQAAKHLMGLAAANFAAGPGKRKRADMGPGQDSSYGAPQEYLVPSQPLSNNEWILGNKE